MTNENTKEYMELTQEELKWLDDHGGRNQSDVIKDKDDRLYVMMGDGKPYGGKPVFLPGYRVNN